MHFVFQESSSIFKALIFIVLFNLPFYSCEWLEEAPPVPILFTGEVSEINEAGALFSGNFKNIDQERVLSFGFVWSTEELPLVIDNNDYRCVFQYEDHKDVYTYRDNSTLIDGRTYFLRSYVIYKNHTYYGNSVSFVSKGCRFPVLSEILPSEAWAGDTILIKGKLFGPNYYSNAVSFNEDPAQIVYWSEDSIRVIVPEFSSKNSYVNTGKINITVIRNGRQTRRADCFRFLPPLIISYNKTEGISMDRFIIYGKGFLLPNIKVRIGNHECKLMNISRDSIDALLPPVFTDANDSLFIENLNGKVAGGKIKVFAPLITDYPPIEVFSNEILRIKGKYLNCPWLQVAINGENSKILTRSDTCISLEVNGKLCGKEFPVSLILDDKKSILPKKIVFKQPANIEITRTLANYFDGSMVIRGNYFPEVSISSYTVSGQSISGNFQYNPMGKSIIELYTNSEVTPKNGWLNARIFFCPEEIFTVDSVFPIPAPEIMNVMGPCYAGKSITITGSNFNPIGNKNEIFINGSKVETVLAESSTSMIFSIPFDFPEGNFSLKVVTNGQESNLVDVNIIRRWEKIADIPIRVHGSIVSFLANNTIYVGGGELSDSRSFYSFDLGTGIWNKKSDVPAFIGTCANDSENGYLADKNAAYTYNFSSDTWTKLPDINLSGQAGYMSTGFLYNDKFFHFPYDGILGNHYYYDIKAGTWTECAGPGYSNSFGIYSTLSSVVNGENSYIFHWYEFKSYNPSTHVFGESISTKFKDNENQSKEGFVYNNEIYFYGIRGFGIHSLNTFKIRYITGPYSGYRNKIYRVNNYAYVIFDNEIWRFNLDMQ